MRTWKQKIKVIVGLIAVTVAVSACLGMHPGTAEAGPLSSTGGDGLVSVETRITQHKVLVGSDGRVAMAVQLSAAELARPLGMPVPPVDLVLVIDRSGSMQGQKISAARSAVQQLIERLGPRDRLALVSYADNVQVVAPLTPMDGRHHRRLNLLVERIQAGGGTNLGGGLQQGIAMLVAAPDPERRRRVVLISDGLANQGITDPAALGRMAAAASDYHFAVSTVGVGLEFNELLMTTIADHGLGRYYFLEDPLVFAQVFEKEFQAARHVAASDLILRIPLAQGVRLIDAGGYPIQEEKGYAVVQPGDLMAGGERKLFLTFQVPTDREGRFTIGGVQVAYRAPGRENAMAQTGGFSLVCSTDSRAVMASVDKEIWGGHVIEESFDQLKEAVADALRRGEGQAAEQYIRDYAAEKGRINAAVGSAAVARHLEQDLKALEDTVADTFAGAPADVAAKQKQNAKALQYESYQQRRGKK